MKRGARSAVAWRSLTNDDLPDLVAMMRRVLAADGGLPLAADEAFLRRRYLASASTGGFEDATLVAAAGLRLVGEQVAAIGMVDPDRRGEGLGSRLVGWARQAAGAGAVRQETESLTPDADVLFRRAGLRQTFAEDVMRRDLSSDAPDTPVPAGVDLTPWTADLAGRFFQVYAGSFADRRGNPGWSAEQWIAWISDDEEFAPEWTLLATKDGADVGFVASGRGAWIVQVGVRPEQRGTGLGAGLTAEALRRMRSDGQTEVLLDVNVNNPGAARVYRRLGFAVIGRRARYESPAQ